LKLMEETHGQEEGLTVKKAIHLRGGI
jgi:hypothetical protein